MSRLTKAPIFMLGAWLALVSQTGAGRAAEVDFATWLGGVRQEAIAQGIRPQSVTQALAGAHQIDRVLELDRHQPETTLTFEQYIDLVVSPQRVQQGHQNLQDHRGLLEQVSRRYAVQPRFIVALWGIESNYGKGSGDFPEISALATLAYDGRRSAYFRKELMAAIKIVDQGWIRPEDMLGSWAGAMGQCQFMPSSYLQFAVSYNDDGRRDIWHRHEDIFASIANYLARSGWHGDESWGRRVFLPAGFDASLAGLNNRKPLAEWQRLGIRALDGRDLVTREREASLILPDGPTGPALLAFSNFRATLKWNNSSYFAAAVGYLADGFE
ncbi:MAG TPA: lytic murein transglycosylase [Stellaceae bacterium]|nr:lytic murein transglycosylase [Stellaceae bacterium]